MSIGDYGLLEKTERFCSKPRHKLTKENTIFAKTFKEEAMLSIDTFYSNLVQGSGVNEETAGNAVAQARPAITAIEETYRPGLIRLTQLSLSEVVALTGDQGWEAWGQDASLA